jgi:formate dehydrogenase subunit gamma
MGAGALARSLKDVAELSVQPVYCLGNCALAPAAMIDNRLLGRVTAARLARAVEELAP